MPDSRGRTVAVAHHPTEIQPWPQMPYPGGSRSLSQDHRHHLEAKEASLSSVIDVANAMRRREHRECGFCNGKNHYRAVCQKAASVQKGGGAQPQQKQGKGKSPGKSTGKPKAKYAHSVVLKTVPLAKGVVSEMDERASVQNSVTSEPSVPVSKAAKWENPVLSGNKQSKAALKTHNMFSCDSIHDTGDGTLDQCQTDTDPSGYLCIMIDILVRARTNSRTHNIRVKADPGADANLMPIHHFRTIFPYLCDSSGHLKEDVLKKAESNFESYSRDNVIVIRQTKIYAKNK